MKTPVISVGNKVQVPPKLLCLLPPFTTEENAQFLLEVSESKDVISFLSGFRDALNSSGGSFEDYGPQCITGATIFPSIQA